MFVSTEMLEDYIFDVVMKEFLSSQIVRWYGLFFCLIIIIGVLAKVWLLVLLGGLACAGLFWALRRAYADVLGNIELRTYALLEMSELLVENHLRELEGTRIGRVARIMAVHYSLRVALKNEVLDPERARLLQPLLLAMKRFLEHIQGTGELDRFAIKQLERLEMVTEVFMSTGGKDAVIHLEMPLDKEELADIRQRISDL